MSKKSRAKRKITELPILIEAKHLYESLNEGSDLTCVLVAGAFLDQALASVLKQVLIDADKLLVDDYGILNSWAARADMCLSMGLISEMQYHNITRIRKIRNKMAHSHEPIDWSDSDIATWCEDIRLPIPVDVSGKPMKPGEGGFFSHKLSARVRFTTATVMTYNQVIMIAMGAKKAMPRASTEKEVVMT